MYFDDQETKILNNLKAAGKFAGKKLARAIFKLVAPYLPILAIIAFCVFILLMLVGAVYSSLPSSGVLAGIGPSQDDEKLKAFYVDLAERYSYKDLYRISGNEKKPFYPGKSARFDGGYADYYGRDREHRLEWGLIHSALLYRAYCAGEEKIDLSLAEKVADELHPVLYYRASTITYYPPSNAEDAEPHTEKIWLLAEAYTYRGHIIYKYKPMTTETRPDGSAISYEPPAGFDQILANPYQRLDDWMAREYGIVSDFDLARKALLEAGKGFTQGKETLEWLLEKYQPEVFSSGAMIPPELMAYFKEASDRYGIPVWFLAAVAWVESGFLPDADNSGTGSPVYCYGIMQVSEENWNAYAPRLGYDPKGNRNDPKAQIDVGAYMLHELGLKYVNWNSPDWKEQTLAVLTHYGGFQTRGRYSSPQERCRKEYAEKIWGVAESLRSPAVWPVPGRYAISNYFRKVDPSLYQDYHHGIDIPAERGEQVVSASAGIVTFAGWLGDYGWCVKITDGSHIYLYAHLSKIAVSQGQTVRPGGSVGLIGDTGKAFGCHLHFEVRGLSDDLNSCIDPLLLAGSNML
ncbi:MAG: peptidoglycan DD-metalloendopeptidase family protein [Peptococcaceae bacterium]|nr:peptidoglycan DD-metalloendopeptidase family protein [Peptococcaceae bacterium]